MPLQRSEIKALLLYLFTEPQGCVHNDPPHQEVSPTFTVTEGEPDTCSMKEPSLRAAVLSPWQFIALASFLCWKMLVKIS